MKHIEAGVTVGAAMLIIVLIVSGLAHFVGGTWAGIILTAVVVVGIGAAVIDYITEEER